MHQGAPESPDRKISLAKFSGFARARPEGEVEKSCRRVSRLLRIIGGGRESGPPCDA